MLRGKDMAIPSSTSAAVNAHGFFASITRSVQLGLKHFYLGITNPPTQAEISSCHQSTVESIQTSTKVRAEAEKLLKETEQYDTATPNKTL